MTERRCVSCKYWEPIESGQVGQCRVLPAKIVSYPASGTASLHYGIVYPNGYCDEWKGVRVGEASQAREMYEQ